MTAREYPVFTVTPKAERSLRAGHPWVYGEEVTAVEGAYQNGDMVDVVSNKGRYLGTGWVNDHSKIRVRIISRNANDSWRTMLPQESGSLSFPCVSVHGTIHHLPPAPAFKSSL